MLTHTFIIRFRESSQIVALVVRRLSAYRANLLLALLFSKLSTVIYTLQCGPTCSTYLLSIIEAFKSAHKCHLWAR